MQPFRWTNYLLNIIAIFSVMAIFILSWTLMTPTKIFFPLGFLLVFKKIWLPAIPYIVTYIIIAFLSYKKWRLVLVICLPIAYLGITNALMYLPEYIHINVIHFPFYLSSAVGIWYGLLFGLLICLTSIVCLIEHARKLIPRNKSK